MGQRTDYTALCVVEETVRHEAGKPVAYYTVCFLSRLAVGTTYPQIRARLAEVVAGVRTHGGALGRVYVDVTGLGAPVVRELRGSGVGITPVYFNHGDRREERPDHSIALGNAYLVAQLQVLLQRGRILLPKTEEATALARDLVDYEIRLVEDASSREGAFTVGSRDDLITALGLATQGSPRREIRIIAEDGTWQPADRSYWRWPS